MGRKDNSKAAPDGYLPAAFGANATHDVLVSLFADKGFSATDLTALVGAHTVAVAFAQQSNGLPAGCTYITTSEFRAGWLTVRLIVAQQDTTPSNWDTKFFKQTQNANSNIKSFQSDTNLAKKGTNTGKAFTKFGNSKSKFPLTFTHTLFMWLTHE